MIADLLKYAKQSPTSVIIGLLAIIGAGSVGGGLWIQSLRFAIDERDKIVTQRLELLEARNWQNLQTLKQANTVLRQQAEIIVRSTGDLSTRLKAVADILNELRDKGVVTGEIATRLEATTQSVTRDAESLAAALERVQDLARFMQATRTWEGSGSFAREALWSRLFFIVGVMLVVATALVAVYVFRRAWQRRYGSNSGLNDNG